MWAVIHPGWLPDQTHNKAPNLALRPIKMNTFHIYNNIKFYLFAIKMSTEVLAFYCIAFVHDVKFEQESVLFPAQC